MLKVRINDKVYCGLIDTGTQVSLISVVVVRVGMIGLVYSEAVCECKIEWYRRR